MRRMGKSGRALGLGLGLAVVLAAVGTAEAGVRGARVRTVRFSIELPEGAIELERSPADPATGQPLDPRVFVRWRGEEPALPTAEPGTPDLPEIVRLVALPAGAAGIEVRARVAASQAFEDVPLVGWAELARVGQSPPDPAAPSPYYPIPPRVDPVPGYAEQERWPARTVEAGQVLPFAGLQVLRLRVRPVEWRPLEARLLLHRQIDVEVSFRGPAAISSTRTFADAQARARLRQRVVNPTDMPDRGLVPPRLITDAPYLIVTDNHRWLPDVFLPGIPVGNLVGEFERLAEWKTQKGWKAEVVTISDIAAGKYGDFRTPSRDVPEMIRRFLKFARARWNTYWVLLGGDVSILPPRYVLGTSRGNGMGYYFNCTPNPKPEPQACDSSPAGLDAATTRLIFLSDTAPQVQPGNRLVMVLTGKAYERTTAPSPGNPGWAYVNPLNPAQESAVPTSRIVLRAPAFEIGGPVVADLDENTIPTDLYYASLDVPSYFSWISAHDWDLNGNGIYGQYSWLGDQDGVIGLPNLSVGRAPVRDAAEAARFVDKVLDYEKSLGPTAPEPERLLLNQSNWYQPRPGVYDPFPKGQYWSGPGYACSTSGGSYSCSAQFGMVPIDDTRNWDLVLTFNDGTFETVPPVPDPPPGGFGYGFLECGTYCLPATTQVVVNGVPIQLPKPTIRLTVARPDPYPRRVTGLFFASKVLDPAAIEKEAVRADLEVLAPGWRDRTRLYEEASKLPSAPDLGLVSAWSVLSALNGGVNAVSASGHGDPGGCCGFSDPPTRPAGLVYADSCLTNAFDRNGLGARWTRDAAGAVAYIGNSRYSWIGRGAVLERAFWADAVRGQIGWANDGRSWLVSDWFLRWTNFSLNLMGDPEMQLWAGTPEVGTMLAPTTIILGDPVRIRASDALGAPLGGAQVAIVGPRGLLDVRWTHVDGVADLQAPADAGSTLTVTLSGRGVVPVQAQVAVLPPAGSAVPGRPVAVRRR